MKKHGFETPILLLTFNRPDLVVRQLALLKEVGATNVYIACDGPREANTADSDAVARIHTLIMDNQWDGPVKTLFRDKNEGCKNAVSSAIDWLFSQEEEGIIIEDDCFANVSFFRFAQELLDRYREDGRVWHIGGTNFVPERTEKESYIFSIHPHCWGWATWKRAWDRYDVHMSDWPTEEQNVLSVLHDDKAKRYWKQLFELMYKEKIDTWDYQWVYAIWKHHGLSVLPGKNLVTNIGFDARATHTKLPFSPFARRKSESLDFPLRHPDSIVADEEIDAIIQKSFGENMAKKMVKGIFRGFRG